MQSKKRSDTPMEKLKELLEEWQCQETKRGKRLSKKYPAIIFSILDLAYHNLKCVESFGFLESEVKEILESFGFSVHEEGVGWRVYPY